MVMVIYREAFFRIMFQFPFALFMMRNSFEAVPREPEEAALVDACTTFAAPRRVRLQRHYVRGFMSGAIRG
jgi:ABC-type glycerol-3-phosphate transport system permease component